MQRAFNWYRYKLGCIRYNALVPLKFSTFHLILQLNLHDPFLVFLSIMQIQVNLRQQSASWKRSSSLGDATSSDDEHNSIPESPTTKKLRKVVIVQVCDGCFSMCIVQVSGK